MFKQINLIEKESPLRVNKNYAFANIRILFLFVALLTLKSFGPFFPRKYQPLLTIARK